MKKIYSSMILLFACLSLAACSGQRDGGNPWKGIQADMDDLSFITDRTEYYDIVAEQEPVFQWGQGREGSPLATKGNIFVGMQFYQGEPVQLWCEPAIRGESMFHDLYLYKQDGRRELLLEDAYQYHYYGYLDQKGNLYWWHNSTVSTYSDGGTETISASLEKYDPSGKLLFDKQLDPGLDITDIRQTANGKMYLVIHDNTADTADSRWLARLNPATGLITKISTVQLAGNDMSRIYLGVYGNKLAAYKVQFNSGNEITEVNTGNGTESCFFSFQGTSYMEPDLCKYLQDFQILEDGSVEILWSTSDGSKSLREKLRMAKVEKIPIVLRGVDIIESWLLTQINRFNQSSERYHVIVEDCGTGNDVDDFARLTSIQIASGKGPDILYGRLMQDYISGMLEKGFLEDLHPYMERSNIREEDYFPFTFSTWRDGDRICGVIPASPTLVYYYMDSAVLGGTEEPDIETLADALLAWHAGQSGQEDAVFLKWRDSQELLRILLKSTDTLWGMVDWEKGSCDFSGALFAKLLETAKLYGDREDGREVRYIAESKSLEQIYLFNDRAERERDGKTICGAMFDDGCHVAATSSHIFAVNTNSSNKEGAWEFISFLLGDEVQSSSSSVPASRKAFDTWVERTKNKFADGKEIDITYAEQLADGSLVTIGSVTYTEADITEEIIEEYIEALEDTRPYPLRTVPILDIISEEAADYFNGSKSAAEVARLVTNRVQLYLDERH